MLYEMSDTKNKSFMIHLRGVPRIGEFTEKKAVCGCQGLRSEEWAEFLFGKMQTLWKWMTMAKVQMCLMLLNCTPDVLDLHMYFATRKQNN
jgi:hypothetical protein